MKSIINKLTTLPRRIINFFKEVFNELTKIEWLSRKKTVKYTIIIVISIVVGVLFILALDKLFLEVRNLIIT